MYGRGFISNNWKHRFSGETQKEIRKRFPCFPYVFFAFLMIFIVYYRKRCGRYERESTCDCKFI